MRNLFDKFVVLCLFVMWQLKSFLLGVFFGASIVGALWFVLDK